jgi:hypothetical protein
MDGFPNVINALRASPGVLGVETGETRSGKRVIFAWLTGKKALIYWYHSDAHQKAMKAVYPRGDFEPYPLQDLPENSGPILAIVSVSFSGQRIATIGIELYGPLPGGVAVGGRFAPEALEVRGLRRIDLGAAQRQE